MRGVTEMDAKKVKTGWIICAACEGRYAGKDGKKMTIGRCWGTCGGLYTVKYTVVYTVVYTVRTVYGALWRFFTNIYEPKRVENTKRISRYSTY